MSGILITGLEGLGNKILFIMKLRRLSFGRCRPVGFNREVKNR
ncbi:hypothetical protein SCFA_780004 [anaerobic digester metagenome]|uniref:Uncharacterized protein n=1 Tax=anaerobic digester metagenome TaxID=1263854 RepID=A0A485M4J3_9ZZZZ